MDFNNIKARLERTLQSLNARFEIPTSENINITFVYSDIYRAVLANFGRDNELAILNKINIILYNLSSLKDHLKNCLKSNGHNPKIIENEINNSFHLQILIDLVNQEKHGYPLSKSNRSNKNPIIKNPFQALNLSTGTMPQSAAGITLFLDGNYQMFGENNNIIISAEICDGNGNKLFMLEELVETCFDKWENIAQVYNCI